MPAACPFVAGPTIEDPSLFVGRRDKLRILASKMSGAQPVSVNVVGERRIGKSSLLYHFFLTWGERLEHSARFVVLYLDLQKDDPATEAEFYHLLAAALADRPRVAQIEDLRLALSRPPQDHKEFGTLMEAFASHELLPIFCLDEFEMLLKHPAFKDSFFDRRRGFMNANQLMFILSSRQSVDVCAGEQKLTSAFFNLGHVLSLGEFTEEDAAALMRLPLLNRHIPALQESDQRLARKWGGRHPYLLQLAAIALFEARQAGKDTAWAFPLWEKKACSKDMAFATACGLEFSSLVGQFTISYRRNSERYR